MKLNKNVSNAAVLLGVSFIALSSTDALAQATSDAAVESAPAGDVIIVSARRREESLQDVPVAISVASQATLEKLAISNPETLTKLDPALVMANRQGTRDVFTPFIRGQGAASSAGSTQSVVTYFSEVPFFRPSFVDLENIQVLKGPQGTLFGETATGGVLLFTPRKPGDTFEGYVTGEAGNYGYRMLEGALTLPVIPDVWSVRFAGQIRKRNGYTRQFFSQPGATPTDADNIDTSDLRITSRFRPLDNLEILTVLAQSTSDSNGSGYILSSIYDRVVGMRRVPAATASTAASYQYFSGLPAPAGLTFLQIMQQSLAQSTLAGPRTAFSSHALNTNFRFQGLTNQINWDITPDVRLRSITGLFRTRNGPNSGLNPDASLSPTADNIGAICIQGVSPASCRVNGPRTFTTELQLQANLLGGALNLQAGGYYRNVSKAPWAAAAQFVVNGASTGNNTALTRSGSKSSAVYGQATFEVVKGVHLTAGVRNTWDQTFTYSTTAPAQTTVFNGTTIALSAFAPTPTPGAAVTEFKSPRGSAISYTFSADWKVTDNVLVWLTHRKGYKPGGVNRLVPVTDANYLYQPETLKDVEAGIRGSFDLGSAKIRTSLVGYRGNYSNVQRSSFGINSATGSYVQLTLNVAKATIQGLEYSLDIDANDYFSLGASLAYNDAKFDSWTETQTCARQPYRTGCLPLSTAAAAITPVLIDHVAGSLTANGVTETFTPDVFAQAPKLRWTIRPTVKFGFLGSALEGASLSASVTHTSSHATTDVNYSAKLAAADTIVPGYTLVDLRFDWADAVQERLGLFAGVTNLFNRTIPVETTDVTSTCDCVFSIYNEPRMFYAGVKYDF